MGDEEKETLGRTIGVNVLLLILGLGVAYGLYAGLQLGYSTDAPLRVVISESMIPKYNVNDVVIVKGVGSQIVPILYVFNVPLEGVSVSSLKVGDDVIYICVNPRCPFTVADPIVHEIIQITPISSECGGGIQFTTHGINNGSPSPSTDERPCGSDVIGVVTGKIPYVGFVSGFLRSGLGIMFVLLLIGILFAIDLLEEKGGD